jgi:hypothetical protein
MRLLLTLLLLPLAFANNNDAPANEDIAKELEQYNRQAEQVLQQVDRLQNLAPVPPEQMDRLKRKALTLAHDDRFLQSAESLWKSESRNKMLLLQAGWFLFMLLFKAWRQSRSTHWFRRLLVGFACSLLTWIGLLYVIPLLALGEPFAVFTGTLWRVLVWG